VNQHILTPGFGKTADEERKNKDSFEICVKTDQIAVFMVKMSSLPGPFLQTEKQNRTKRVNISGFNDKIG